MMGKEKDCNSIENLKQAFERLRALFNEMDGPIYVSDPETFEILFVNEKIRKIFGENILGRKCYKVFQNLNNPCSFCTNKHIFGENLGKTHIWEFQNQKNKHWYRCIDKAIEWPSGKHVRFEIAIDITEHKRLEKALQENEEKFRLIFENAKDAIFWADAETGLIINCNKATESLLEKNREEIIGRLHTTVHPPQKEEYYAEMFKRRLKREEAVDEEAEVITKSGKIIPVHITASTTTVAGKPLIQGIIRDINERKKAEEALKESEEKFRALAEQSPNMIFINKSGRVVYANKKSEEVMGYKREEFYSPDFDFLTLIAPESIDLIKENFRRHMKGEKVAPYEYTLVTKEGNRIEALITSKLVRYGEEKAILGIVADITERKKAEEKLRSSEEKYRTLFELAPDAIVTYDLNGVVTSCNTVAATLSESSKDEIVGRPFTELGFCREEDIPKYLEIFRSILEEKPPEPFEVTWRNRDGALHTSEIRVSLLKEDNKILGVQAVIRDITERKRMEEALRESEQLFRTIVENSHDWIIIVDDKFRITYANEEAARLSGYRKEEMVGQDFRKFLDKDGKLLIRDRYLRRQRGEKVPSKYEFKIIRKDGEKRDVLIKSTVIQDSQGRAKTIAQLLDITDRKIMEEKRKRFEDRVSALHTYAHSLNMTDDVEEIYRLTLNAMEKTLGFEYASVLLVEGKLLRLVAQRGYSKGLTLLLPLEGKKGVTVKAARTGKSVFIPNLRRETSYVEGGVSMLSELSVPIKMKDEVLGVLNVESKKLAAFKEEDKKLLETLASHAGIAISNVKRNRQLREISKKIANLMKSSTEIMRAKDTPQRLNVIARAIRNFGWRRVVISLRDENLEGTDLVTSGLTDEEVKLLLERKAPGYVWRERLGPKFERFRIGGFYYLPWSDPWIREQVHGVPPEASPQETTTYAGVPSKLSPEEMVDWHPQDMVYAPLRTPEGRIVGILSMDDPVDGRRPNKESLAPLELFLHQAAMVIENSQLIESLREARKQLEVHAEQLEQKVEERTRELKKSQEQLLKAQRLAVIGEVAGMVGHDLRNPLTSIAGVTYYLKKRLDSKIDSRMKEMLQLVEKNIAYSNKIINDLLDYSREIKLDLTDSNPKSMVREALSLVEIPKNVQVIDLTENKPKMMIDVGKMKRAFVNIIKNSIEAMPKGGKLTIKSKKSDGNLEFAFSDTGVGMSKKTRKKLWTPLFTTKAKGMGFGLAICKRTIEAHGGSICVESVRGKGTTFIVTIPTRPKIEGGEKIWVKLPESSLLTTTKT